MKTSRGDTQYKRPYRDLPPTWVAKSAYGYIFIRKKHSTYMTINNLYDIITNAIDRKLHTVGIFLDLSNAFDTLDHSTLLQKLNHCGIRGISNDWIKNYLKGRHQFVVYDKTSSVTNTIHVEFPKARSWGPYCSCCTSMTCRNVQVPSTSFSLLTTLI